MFCLWTPQFLMCRTLCIFSTRFDSCWSNRWETKTILTSLRKLKHHSCPSQTFSNIICSKQKSLCIYESLHLYNIHFNLLCSQFYCNCVHNFISLTYWNVRNTKWKSCLHTIEEISLHFLIVVFFFPVFFKGHFKICCIFLKIK